MSIFSRIFKKREKHLTFRGIEIDGSISEFKAKMVELGYTPSIEKDAGMAFEGSFAEKEKCIICVVQSKKIEKVYKVEVSFPEEEDWEILKKDYFVYKELLTEKYGNPATSYEMNLPKYKFEEIDEMEGIIEGKCMYTSIFETPLGHVLLQITADEYGVFIKIGYEDLINIKLHEKSQREEIIKDL